MTDRQLSQNAVIAAIEGLAMSGYGDGDDRYNDAIESAIAAVTALPEVPAGMSKELAEAMARIEATVATWRRIGEDQRADDMQMLLDALAAPEANDGAD